MLLVQLLKDYRAKKAITGRQLAKKIGIDYHAYWRFEQGRPMDQRHFVKLLTWVFNS